MHSDHIITPPCPLCKSAQVRLLGRLEPKGGLITLPDPGCLYDCRNCGLLFRFPYLDSESLMQAYENIDSSLWEYGDMRPDVRLTLDTFGKYCKSGKVMDVGCFRGDFLQLLPCDCHRYGIEPSSDAALVARERNVRVIASSIDKVEGFQGAFDAITMMDVIEHLPEPREAMEKLSGLLRQGGVLLITTGNTDALPWRVLRLGYWYYFSEHVSFLNKKSFAWLATFLDMDILEVKDFSHKEASAWRRFMQLVEAVAFAMTHRKNMSSVFTWLCKFIYPLNRAIHWKESPETTAWRDHVVVVMRKR